MKLKKRKLTRKLTRKKRTFRQKAIEREINIKRKKYD